MKRGVIQSPLYKIGQVQAMGHDRKIHVIFSLVFPLFLLLLSYLLVVAFYPLTSEQQTVFQFLDGKKELAINYTTAEISHLQDVAVVMNNVNIAFYVLAIMVGGILVYSWKRRDLLQSMLRYGGLATISLLCFLLLLLVIDFNWLFTLFHQLFFPQGNWQFAAGSLLIQTFPLGFFVSMGVFIFGLTFLVGVSLLVVSILIKHKYSKN